MAVDKIEILIEAKVKEALSNMEKVSKESKKLESEHKSFSETVKTSWLKIAASAAAFGVAIAKAFDITKEAAKFEQSMTAAQKQFGKDGDLIIKKLKEVSDGTISNANLIEAANRAMALNVTTDLDKMAKLLEVARVRAQAMGIDTTQAFNDIVTGIGRQSPLILDNLGIITKGWAEEAKAAGQAFDQQFILNKILADGAEIIENAGGVVLTNAERIQQFETSIANARLALGEALIPALNGLIKVILPIVEAFTKLPGKVKAVIGVVILLTPLLIALNAAAGPIGLILGGIATAGLAVAAAFQKQNKEVENATKSFSQMRDELTTQAQLAERTISLLKDLNNLRKAERQELIQNLQQLGIDKNFREIELEKREIINRLIARKNSLLQQNTQLGKENLQNQKESNIERDKEAENDEKKKQILPELMTLEQLRFELEKGNITELNQLRLEALKLGILSENELTNTTKAELLKRLQAYKDSNTEIKKDNSAAQQVVTAAWQSFFSTFTEGLKDQKITAKLVLSEIIKSFARAIAGQLEMLAAEAAAKGVAALFSVVEAAAAPGYFLAAAKYTAGAVGVNVLGREVANSITSAAKGADFVTNGPQMMMVGDNPSGRERVQVTPLPGNTVNNDNKNVVINVQSNSALQLVNDLKNIYGIEVA